MVIGNHKHPTTRALCAKLSTVDFIGKSLEVIFDPITRYHPPSASVITFHNPKVKVNNIPVTSRHPWVDINLIKAARSLGDLAIEALYKEVIEDFVELAYNPSIRVENYTKYSQLPIGIGQYYSYICNTLNINFQ